MDAVKEKTISDKIEKKEPLTKEEEIEILKDGDAIPGNKSSVVLPEKEQIPEETDPEKIKANEDAAAAKKKADDDAAAAAAKKPDDTKIDMAKLEEQLSKPDGQEDLKDLSKREIAYFWQMRRDRRERQKAEEEADSARFELSKIKAAKAKEEPAAKIDPLAELKKKDPTDFMTVKDVMGLVETLQKPGVKEEAAPARQQIPQIIIKHLQYCEQEARAAHPEDFDAVIELTGEILGNNSDYLLKVRKALQDGDNPAEVSYQLIKNDPDFAKLLPAAEIRAKAKAKKPESKKEEKGPEELKAEEEAKANEKLLEENKDKAKTTGHVAGGESKSGDQYTLEEIAKMTDKQFRKLPKALRQKYLEQYG